jgi:hypothetical protein
MESIIFFKLITLFTEFDSVFSSYNFATMFSIKQFETHMHMHTYQRGGQNLLVNFCETL